MDREYGSFSKEYFRKHQLHRTLYHNFVFICLLFLVNPYLALGAFCYTLLDGLHSKRPWVEWLYPFSRLVKNSRYNHGGKKIAFYTKNKLYMYQNGPVELNIKTAKDMKDFTLRPWRRIYGPFYSGGILDIGFFDSSTVLFLFLALLYAFEIKTFIDIYPPNLALALLVLGLVVFWVFLLF